MKLSSKIFAGIAAITLAIMLITTVIVTGLLYGILTAETKRMLRDDAAFISSVESEYGDIDFSRVGSMIRNRLTIVAPDGTVKYDSYGSSADMENHADRPEIMEAFESGTGEDTRVSSTFGKETYYYALRLQSGDVLRIACEVSSVFGLVASAMPGILFSIIVLLAAALAFAGALTRSITSSINKIDLDDPLSTETYEELSPLLIRIDVQNKEMIEQLSAVYEAQRENEFITQHMNDGLIIVGTDGRLISVNKAAEKIFNFTYVPNKRSGGSSQTYLSVCRDKNFRKAIENAMSGVSQDITIERGGKTYRISLSSVARDFSSEKEKSRVYAVLLFVHDITEKEAAERIRREFSANVSHELKTPLTSIMGCSEIMKAGIAKPEDAPRFLNQINSEAKRLLALIDDIIRLSSLDEGAGGIEMTDTDIFSVARDVVSELEIKASEHGVSLELDGSSRRLKVNESLIHEMIFNLCDNAIRYNNKGGFVRLEVKGDDSGRTLISVKDNGIGIPKSEQKRIFERFYRVDKSHSRETGGTGLGLSIVKHAVMIHNGEISIDSEVGKGTEIVISL